VGHLKAYNLWLNEESLSDDLKEDLKKLTDEEILESFYKDIEFGTAGARGIMGPGTNRMNIYTVKKMSLGFAKYIKRVAKTSNYSVAISYDNRNNSKTFAYTAARVLASEGIKTFITKNLRPTPFLSYMVRHFACDGGIMITASHNPKEYNGFKVYDSHGGQLVPEDANKLVSEVNKIKDYFNIQEYNNPNYIKEVDYDLDQAYLTLVKEIQLTNLEEKPLKFVYSPLHGTGGKMIKELLEGLGYNIITVRKEMVPDGDFTYTKSSNPEESEAYINSLKLAKKENADLILVTDPDADRLGIIVKHNDSYIPLNGNQTAALELYYILNRRNELNTLDRNGIIYSSNVTTPLIIDIAKSFNIEVKEVLTGFKFIGEAIRNTNRTYIFGSEESYGSLISPFVRDKDAIQAVLLLVEMATYYKTFNLTLYDVLLNIYKEFGTYAEKTLSITYEGISGQKKIKKIMKTFQDNYLVISGEVLKSAEDYNSLTIYENGKLSPLDFDKANVLRFIYESNNRVILRPSGTEPKLKIYLYVKDETLTKANNRLQEIEKEVLQKVKEV